MGLTMGQAMRVTYAPPSLCSCYVRQLPEEQRFDLRSGAHEIDCPAWKRSLDPVDDAHDREARYHLGGFGTCPWCEPDVR